MRDMSNKTAVPKSKWIPDELFQIIQKSVPIACVDLIILRKGRKGHIETLLIKRKIYPEIGKWCLIGGRILYGERAQDALKRQAKRELGVSVKIIPPCQATMPIMSLSDPVADKQKHFVVLVYPVTIIEGTVRKIGPEFSEAKWFLLNKIPKTLGFAHRQELESFTKSKLFPAWEAA